MSEPIVAANKSMIVLLPFATPHKSFKSPWGVYHPAGLLMPKDRRSTVYNENADYTGYQSVKIASKLSHTIVATIPPKSTIAGQVLDQLLSTFINPENILAEVERVECNDPTIAGQIRAALDTYTHASSVLIVWPYQVFGDLDTLHAAGGEADFSYSHPLANHVRHVIPECVVVSSVEDDKNGSEMECKDVQSYDTLDEMLKGNYTRTIAIAEVTRSDFEEFESSHHYPNMGKLLQKALVGKRGIMINNKGHQFI